LNLDLQRAIHSYQNELWPRHRVKNAVYDAIDGFCEDRCEWFRTGVNGPGINVLVCRPSHHLGWFPGRHFLQMPMVCPYCNRETFEQFDILKEEGI
jgi:hypothetical protein